MDAPGKGTVRLLKTQGKEGRRRRFLDRATPSVRSEQRAGKQSRVPSASGSEVVGLVTLLRRQAALLLEWADKLERGETISQPGGDLCGAGGGEADSAVFCREGEFWKIAYRGKTAQLKHRVGFDYLRALLSNPGREIAVLDLVGGAIEWPAVHRSENGGTQRGLLRSSMEARAVLASLESELAEAESNNDFERARVLRERRRLFSEFLLSKAKNVAAGAERARVAVAKAVQRALAAIAREFPELASHLHRRVRIGYICRYDDLDDQPPRWIVA